MSQRDRTWLLTEEVLAILTESERRFKWFWLGKMFALEYPPVKARRGGLWNSRMLRMNEFTAKAKRWSKIPTFTKVHPVRVIVNFLL